MNTGLAILIGLLAIAAAIYLRPSEYDRCVDRNLPLVEGTLGSGDEAARIAAGVCA